MSNILTLTLAVAFHRTKVALTKQQIKVVDQQIEELKSKLLSLEYQRWELLDNISKLEPNKE